MDAAPIDSAAMTQARRLMGVALVVAPAATQVAWLISNHFARWPLRLGLPLVGGVLLAWALCRLHRAACRHWADDARAQRRLFALAAGTWPLLLFLPAALLRLVYPDGLIPYLAFGVFASMWSVNAVTALLPEGLIPRLVRAGTLTVLAVGLGWHLLGLATGTGRFDPARENRNPAPPPEWPTTVAEVQAWPRAFERYFDDQFRGRMHLVSFASSVDLLVLNRNFNPLSVVRGEQGWLYRNSGERQLEYAYRWTFPPELIDGFERNLADRVAWLRANDQKYLLVLTPDKRSVHPEFIPQFPLEPGRPGKLDQIVPRFDRLGVAHLDLRAPLRDSPAKAQGPLFYKHDVHWNLRGAWVADQHIAQALRERFALRPAADLADDAWTWSTAEWTGGDLARFMGNPDLFRETVPLVAPTAGWRARLVQRGGRPGEGRIPLREDPDMDYIETWEVDDPTLPTAVIFHDSSGVCLRPFIRERFRRTVLVWSWFPSRALIEQEKPDVVIQVRGEEFADLLAMPDVQEYTDPPR